MGVYRYHVPVTHDEDDWMQPRGASEQYLTAEAAQKLRADKGRASGNRLVFFLHVVAGR